MLILKFYSPSDFSFEDAVSGSVFSGDGSFLRAYPSDFRRKDFFGWYLIEVGNGYIKIANSPTLADESVYACVCLDCGHKTTQLEMCCENCGSQREPAYLEI